MKVASLRKDLQYKEDKVSLSVMMESETSKEIRILFRKGQSMKEHPEDSFFELTAFMQGRGFELEMIKELLS